MNLYHKALKPYLLQRNRPRAWRFEMKLLWRLSTFAIVLGFLFSLIAFVPFVSADDGQDGPPSRTSSG